MSLTTTRYSIPPLEEHFTRYTLYWNPLGTRTDTPDLMGAFQKAEDRALIARGARAQAEEDEQMAEADMAVGFETLDD
jgi:hypothetical protein